MPTSSLFRRRTKDAPKRDTARVTLYARAGCHLCEEAKLVITSSGCKEHFTLEEIDIDPDPALVRRYGLEVPVVAINGVETFKVRLTADEFRRELLKAERAAGPD